MLDFPLMAHQRTAVEKARGTPNLAIFYGVGVGKTRTMIEILREDYTGRGRLRNTLIVAPISVCPQWKEEFAKWSNIPQDQIHVLTGTGKSRVEQLNRARTWGGAVIAVTNYEGVARIAPFYQALLSWSPEIVVLDEAHKLKDPDSMQAKKIYPLCQGAERRFVLTGTPILNSMMDVFGQYKALDPTVFGSSLWKFKTLYFYDRNAGRPNCNYPDWQPKPESAKEISAKLARTSVQAKREECIDLPPLQKIIVPVELSPEQAKAYREMKQHYVTEVKGSQIVAEFAMTKTLRMQQILAGFVVPDPLSKAVWCDDLPRLAVLEDLLERINKEKVIIWTNWRPTYAKIQEVCEKQGYKVALLTGDQSAIEKQRAIEDFCTGGVNALVANPAAGGAGINLQVSRYSIYYSRGYNLEHFLQSEGRNYRQGTVDKVLHYHITAKGTLDEVIMHALLAKKHIGDTVLDWARKISLDTVSEMGEAVPQGVN